MTDQHQSPAGTLDDEEEFSLALSAARGRRSTVAPPVEVVRSLTPDDLPQIANSIVKSPPQTISRLRHSHHQLARLLANGAELVEASLITGYDTAYISRIASEDPSFKELVAYYASVDEEAYVDVVKRMRTLGLTAVEVLQERIDSSPDSFSHREAMELVKLNLVEPMQRTGAVNPVNIQGSGTVQVNLNFVAPTATKTIEHDSDNGPSELPE